jgi:hypothetical protein
LFVPFVGSGVFAIGGSGHGGLVRVVSGQWSEREA